MMDCNAVEESLSQYLDGEIDPRTRLEVEVHLRRCASCQAAYRKTTSIKACLNRTCKTVRAPEDFTTTLQRRLRQMESHSLLDGERTGAKLRRTLMLTVVGVALSLSVGLLALLLLLQRGDGLAADEPDAAGLAQWRLASTTALGAAPASASRFLLAIDASGSLPHDLQAPLPGADLTAERAAEQPPVVFVSY